MVRFQVSADNRGVVLAMQGNIPELQKNGRMVAKLDWRGEEGGVVSRRIAGRSAEEWASLWSAEECHGGSPDVRHGGSPVGATVECVMEGRR